MSYKVKLYENEERNDSFEVIPASSIFAFSIDPNRASNDDPFEIVGRTAKISIIREEPYISLLSNLITWSIEITTESPNLTTIKDFFRHWVDVIDESTNAVIFS